MQTLTIKTRSQDELVDITADVRRFVYDSDVYSGTCTVYCPHTTAGMIIQENQDPDVVHDLLLWLREQVPRNYPGFRHGEGNSDSHIKSSLLGSSVTVLIERGELVLGTWQGIFFCEFDGPRNRSVHIQLMGEKRI